MKSNENAQYVEQTAALNNETLKQKIYYSNGSVTIGSAFWTIKYKSIFDTYDVVVPRESVFYVGRVKHIAIGWFLLTALALIAIFICSKEGIWDGCTIAFSLALIFAFIGMSKSYNYTAVFLHNCTRHFVLPISWGEVKDCMDGVKKCLNNK